MSVRSFVQDNYKKLKICARDDCRRLSSIATRVRPATRGVVWHAGDGVHTRFSKPCCIPPRVFSLRKPRSQRHVYPIEWRHASIILGFAKNGIQLGSSKSSKQYVSLCDWSTFRCRFRVSRVYQAFGNWSTSRIEDWTSADPVLCSIDSVHEFAEQLRIHKICLLVVSTSVRSLWYSFPEVKLLWYPPVSELRRIRCLIDLLKKKNKKLCAAILKQSLGGGRRDLELHYWEASKNGKQ